MSVMSAGSISMDSTSKSNSHFWGTIIYVKYKFLYLLKTSPKCTVCLKRTVIKFFFIFLPPWYLWEILFNFQISHQYFLKHCVKVYFIRTALCAKTVWHAMIKDAKMLGNIDYVILQWIKLQNCGEIGLFYN